MDEQTLPLIATCKVATSRSQSSEELVRMDQLIIHLPSALRTYVTTHACNFKLQNDSLNLHN